MSSVLKLSGPLKVGVLASDPSGASDGFIYFNSTDGAFRMQENGAFREISAEALELHLADDSLIKHDANQVQFQDSAASAKNVAAGPVESQITNLDDAIGDLTFVPTNYTDPATDSVEAHLQAIDTAIADAGQVEFSDAEFALFDDADNTKKVVWQLSGLSTSTTRTITAADQDVSLSDIPTSIQQDGSRAFTANQSMGGFKLTNLADPTNAQDAATKIYVDSIEQGLDIKDSVRAASTANLDLTVAGDGTVDGVTLADGDRVLLKDQTTASENGIYDAVTASDRTTWVRSADADEDAEVTAGMFMFVEEGTSNADSGWVLTTDDPITVGTTDLAFTQFSGAGQIEAGDGLSKSGNTLSVNTGDGIQIVSDNVAVDGTVIRSDGSVTYTAAQDMGSNKITSLADGTAAGDAINKSQLDAVESAALQNVVEDTTPQLGGDLDTNANAILHDGDGLKIANSASPSSVLQKEYVDAITLAASATDSVISELSFDAATFAGAEISYVLKEDTSGDSRIGKLIVVHDGTTPVITDTFTDTAETGISFDVQITTGTVEVTFSSGANGASMRAEMTRYRAI